LKGEEWKIKFNDKYINNLHHHDHGNDKIDDDNLNILEDEKLIIDKDINNSLNFFPKQAQVYEVSVKAGGCGIHDGRLWHGSGQNKSRTRPRRGIGIHFIQERAILKETCGTSLSHRNLNRPKTDLEGI